MSMKQLHERKKYKGNGSIGSGDGDKAAAGSGL